MYNTKPDTNEDIERLEARLVACSNEQVYGIDYEFTSAAVMDMTTVKVLLALAATWGFQPSMETFRMLTLRRIKSQD